MKSYTTTLAVTIKADSIEHRDFLARTIADGINGNKPLVQVAGVITAHVIRAQVKRSRPVRRAK